MIIHILAAALISLVSVLLVVSHLEAQTVRRIVGYQFQVDLILHASILCLFIGTSTLGLIQAEAAGIGFSLWLRAYRKLRGYERYDTGTKSWIRYAGWLT